MIRYVSIGDEKRFYCEDKFLKIGESGHYKVLMVEEGYLIHNHRKSGSCSLFLLTSAKIYVKTNFIVSSVVEPEWWAKRTEIARPLGAPSIKAIGGEDE